MKFFFVFILLVSLAIVGRGDEDLSFIDNGDGDLSFVGNGDGDEDR